MSNIRYPRGFSREVGDEESIDPIVSTDGDSVVNELYRNWVKSGEPEPSWETIQKIIETSKRLIPSLPEFLMANKQLSEYGNTLVDEMLHYITNGKHASMSPLSVLPILDTTDPIMQLSQEQKIARDKMYIKIKGEMKHPADYIGVWLSHCGGVEDIVCTLYVLFGGKRI